MTVKHELLRDKKGFGQLVLPSSATNIHQDVLCIVPADIHLSPCHIRAVWHLCEYPNKEERPFNHVKICSIICLTLLSTEKMSLNI